MRVRPSDRRHLENDRAGPHRFWHGGGIDAHTTEQLDAALDHITAAPANAGRLTMIVSRPEPGERAVLSEGQLTADDGLAGDSWAQRPSRSTADGTADRDRQLTLMGHRTLAVIAGDPDRMPLAGDQLIVDLDLSDANLPPGTRLSIGTAELEITAAPHTGCAKFSERFGSDAARWVNTERGRSLNLRGVNARVVQPGRVAVDDTVTVRRGGAA